MAPFIKRTANWMRGRWAHTLVYGYSILVLGSMSASYFWNFQFIWNDGTSKCEVISNSGGLYFVRNEDWWRVERPQIRHGPAAANTPIDRWLGMRIDDQTQFPGLTQASGEWVSPYLRVTKDTEFTAPRFSRKPGTYRSTTPVSVLAVSYCYLLVLPMAWILPHNFRRFCAAIAD